MLPMLLCAAGANGDIAVINGVLQTANSIFKRYRDQYRSNALVDELAQTQVSLCCRAYAAGNRCSGQGSQAIRRRRGWAGTVYSVDHKVMENCVHAYLCLFSSA